MLRTLANSKIVIPVVSRSRRWGCGAVAACWFAGRGRGWLHAACGAWKREWRVVALCLRHVCSFVLCNAFLLTPLQHGPRPCSWPLCACGRAPPPPPPPPPPPGGGGGGGGFFFFYTLCPGPPPPVFGPCAGGGGPPPPPPPRPPPVGAADGGGFIVFLARAHSSTAAAGL